VAPEHGIRSVIPEAFHDLLASDAVATLATLRADGTPHLTPVWIDVDEGDLLVNARDDRVKATHMRRRPEVAVCVVDPRNPYRYLSVNGVVESVSEEGAPEHMDSLARRYLRVRRYPWAAPGDRRLIFRIRPTRVIADSGEVDVPDPEL
jgi:PPOX class probable F420-dependent enzyme